MPTRKSNTPYVYQTPSPAQTLGSYPPPPLSSYPGPYAAPPEQNIVYPLPQQPTGYSPSISQYQYQHPLPYSQQPPPYNHQPLPYNLQSQPQAPPLPVPYQAPSPFYQAQAQPIPTTRQLTVKNGGLAVPQVLIIDSFTSAPLYSCTFPKREHMSSTPHMFIAGASGAIIGTIHFGSMTSDIDLVIHGQKTELKGNAFKASHEMSSKMPGVGKLKWKNNDVLKGGDIKCTDGNGDAVARFEAGKWGPVQKEGNFELGPTVAGGGQAMDEIVISAIAAVEYARRASKSSENAEAGAEVFSALAGA